MRVENKKALTILLDNIVNNSEVYEKYAFKHPSYLKGSKNLSFRALDIMASNKYFSKNHEEWGLNILEAVYIQCYFSFTTHNDEREFKKEFSKYLK